MIPNVVDYSRWSDTVLLLVLICVDLFIIYLAHCLFLVFLDAISDVDVAVSNAKGAVFFMTTCRAISVSATLD